MRRSRASIAFWVAAGMFAVPSAPVVGQSPELGRAPLRIAIQATPGSSAADIVTDAGTLPFDVAIRMEADGIGAGSPLDDVLQVETTPIWLAVPAPAREEDLAAWRAALNGLITRYRSVLTILEVTIDDQPPPVAAFAVRLAATETRAVAGDAVRLAIGGRRMMDEVGRGAIYTSDLAPYVDLLSMPADAAAGAAVWLSGIDPDAFLALTVSTRPGGVEATRDVLDAILRFAGSPVAVIAFAGGEPLARALQSVEPLTVLLTHDVTDLEDSVAALQLTVAGADVSRSIPHRLLFDNQTFATLLAYWGDGQADALEVELQLTIDGTPVVHDLAAGGERVVEVLSRDPERRTTRMRVPVTGGPMLLDFNRGARDVFGDRSDVVAAAGLSVAEVIARYQTRQRLQDGLVQHYIANARMEQHFRPTAADPGYDVVSENRYFVAGTEIEWEELAFFVNGSRWGADRPPFPLLQPEKVLSLPLLLRFDDGYAYRLAGTERVGDYDCYVVRFEPTRDDDAALYRGTVWIDRTSFARIRVQAVQGGLSAPVVSNEETLDYFPPVLVDGRPVHLLAEVTARQIMMIAGRNLLVEKRVVFDRVRVNDRAFTQERQAARTSDRIMFRETESGLRYYVKRGDERVVSDQPTLSARAMAMGVTLDPSYAFPLPIFGINYLDFDFGGPDTQLALLFGGVLAAGNIQWSSLGSTPFDASLDFFGIAVPSSDRLYSATAEREDERVLTWPLTAGFNAGWQYTPFQKLTGHAHARYDAFLADTTTSDAFTVPASTVTSGLGASWEFRRGGYSLLLSGTEFRRATWRAWGAPAGPDGAPSDSGALKRYAKFSASLSRDWYFNVFHKIHLNGAWFGGRDLDRFSKYQFGLFDDTRIHGVPASGIRFGDLAMVRGSYSLNIFEQYRVDLFLERAWGRDRAIDAAFQPITGLGVAVSFRAPKATMLRADFGRSLLPPRYRTVGSYNLQILILKPLR